MMLFKAWEETEGDLGECAEIEMLFRYPGGMFRTTEYLGLGLKGVVGVLPTEANVQLSSFLIVFKTIKLGGMSYKEIMDREEGRGSDI